MFTASLWEVVAAGTAFAGSHFLLSSAPLRPRLVRLLGERGFLAGYSLIALVTLVWLVISYRAAPYVHLWSRPEWARWLALLVMPVAFVLVVAALRPSNPTAVGADPGGIGAGGTGIFALTRHPMQWGIALWALLHLATNGDAASLPFFGAFAVLSLFGAVHIDQRLRRDSPAGWAELARQTSNVPLVALLQGRTRLAPRALWLPLALGLALYGLMLGLHGWLFGSTPL